MLEGAGQPGLVRAKPLADFDIIRLMSALSPKADIRWFHRDVRFVPEADMGAGM